MKAITDTPGVARSNVAARLKGARTRRGPQQREGDAELSGVVRWGRRKGVAADTWLGRMLACKPSILAVAAQATKDRARVALALLTKGGIYQAPAVSA